MENIGADDLTRRELEVLRTVLAAVPQYQAFAVVAGHLGLDGALEACETHVLSVPIVHEFLTGGWTIRDLPDRESMAQVVMGARVYARQRPGNHRKKRRLADVAKELGITGPEAAVALGKLERSAGPVLAFVERHSL